MDKPEFPIKMKAIQQTKAGDIVVAEHIINSEVEATVFIVNHGKQGIKIITSPVFEELLPSQNTNMINKGQIILDILALVDSEPCNDVDIKSIIEKHTVGLDTHNAQRVRGAIMGRLEELKKENEIDYNPMSPSFTNTTAGQFTMNSFIFHGTHKRFKEQQKKKSEDSKEHKVHIEAGRDVKIDQSFLEDSLAMDQVTKEPTKPQKNIIQRIWNWLMTNPMITGIIAGTTGTVLGYVILKYFHIIK